MAVVLIIGPFFSGHLKPGEGTKGRAAMLTNMRYHTSVIISLFTSLGTLAESSRRIMKLGAFSDRIAELEDVAKEILSGLSSNPPSVLELFPAFSSPPFHFPSVPSLAFPSLRFLSSPYLT